MRRPKRSTSDKVEQNMTPMIDVVFQLLAFFLCTFKVFSQEGDFNIDMPSAMPKPGVPDPKLSQTKKLFLRADPKGELASIHLDDIRVPNFQELNKLIRTQVSTGDAPKSKDEEPEVEFVCDYRLKYHNVVQAIDAVSGFKTSDDRVVPLIEKLKFSPPPKDVPKSK